MASAENSKKYEFHSVHLVHLLRWGRRIAWTAAGVLTFVLLAAMPGWTAEETFRVISISIDPSVTSPLSKIDTVVQNGSDPRNRFTMHRIYKPDARRDHRGSIILLPSLTANFRQYMMNEEHDAMRSLAATLALADYTVYGYSPRTANLPANACSSGAVDCSVIKDWGLNAYQADIEYIRNQVALDYHHEKPAIGGLSLGGMLGVAAVNAHPRSYSGLLLWDAILYSQDPAIKAFNSSICANLNGAIAAGIYYDEQLPTAIKQLTQMGEAASIQFFGNPLGLGTPNFIQLVANPTHTRYQFASFPRVFEMVMGLNDVETLVVIRDVTCSFAGDRTFTANLRQFKAPVFAIKQGQGFGNYMQDTIDLMGSTKIRIENSQAFGHLDAYLASYHATFIERPILDWLDKDVFPSTSSDNNDDNDDQ